MWDKTLVFKECSNKENWLLEIFVFAYLERVNSGLSYISLWNYKYLMFKCTFFFKVAIYDRILRYYNTFTISIKKIILMHWWNEEKRTIILLSDAFVNLKICVESGHPFGIPKIFNFKWNLRNA